MTSFRDKKTAVESAIGLLLLLLFFSVKGYITMVGKMTVHWLIRHNIKDITCASDLFVKKKLKPWNKHVVILCRLPDYFTL